MRLAHEGNSPVISLPGEQPAYEALVSSSVPFPISPLWISLDRAYSTSLPRIVLRSGSDRLDPCGPTDPQLHIFGPENKIIATTDGTDYHFADGQSHPANDPCGAAALAASRP